jgi:hypothetical protein
MTRAEGYNKDYGVLKNDIIRDIFFLIKDQDIENDIDSNELDISRHEIITQVIDDQESEVIHNLELRGSQIIAHAGIYEDDIEYNLEEFEVPMLIKILEAAEKILE